MLRRVQSDQRRPRSGFTMVEILIVITIIAILMALLLPAVMRAIGTGDRTQNFSQVNEIGAAIGLAKQKLNLPQIPPGPFRLKSVYTGTEGELLYLTAAWPDVPWTSGGYYLPLPSGVTQITLDTNQTLVFFLTGGTITNGGNVNAPFVGFSTNPANPFLPANPGDKRIGPFLQSSAKNYAVYGSTLYRSPIFGATADQAQNSKGQAVTETVTAATQSPPQAWLVDPYGMPYAYFAALNGLANMYYAPPHSTSIALNTGISQSYTVNGYTVSPYMQSTSTFFNPQGFQVISAGKDTFFGPGGLLVNGKPAGETGFDDVTNISKTVMGGGIN